MSGMNNSSGGQQGTSDESRNRFIQGVLGAGYQNAPPMQQQASVVTERNGVHCAPAVSASSQPSFQLSLLANLAALSGLSNNFSGGTDEQGVITHSNPAQNPFQNLFQNGGNVHQGAVSELSFPPSQGSAVLGNAPPPQQQQQQHGGSTMFAQGPNSVFPTNGTNTMTGPTISQQLPVPPELLQAIPPHLRAALEQVLQVQQQQQPAAAPVQVAPVVQAHGSSPWGATATPSNLPALLMAAAAAPPTMGHQQPALAPPPPTTQPNWQQLLALIGAPTSAPPTSQSVPQHSSFFQQPHPNQLPTTITTTTQINPTQEEMSSSGGRKEPPFPSKLHDILRNEQFKEFITWNPSGTSWRILKPSELETSVLPTHFRHGKYASFMRQVNGWAFKRLGSGPDEGSYAHPLFLRDDPQRSLRMRRIRKKSKSTGSSHKSETSRGSRQSSNSSDRNAEMHSARSSPARQHKDNRREDPNPAVEVGAALPPNVANMSSMLQGMVANFMQKQQQQQQQQAPPQPVAALPAGMPDAHSALQQFAAFAAARGNGAADIPPAAAAQAAPTEGGLSTTTVLGLIQKLDKKSLLELHHKLSTSIGQISGALSAAASSSSNGSGGSQAGDAAAQQQQQNQSSFAEWSAALRNNSMVPPSIELRSTDESSGDDSGEDVQRVPRYGI